MSILGNVGSIYMVILILLIVVGLGLIITGFFRYLKESGSNKNLGKGGDKMSTLQNNSWLKLSIFCLVGIVVAVLILSIFSSFGFAGYNTTNHMSQYGMNTPDNMHGTSSFMGTGTGTGMMMSNSNMGMNMGNMNQNDSAMTSYDSAAISQRLYYMQMQINQMQQMMNYMSNMSGMGNMGGMNGMGNMSGMNGMSGMGNMGGMSGTGNTSGSNSMPMM